MKKKKIGTLFDFVSSVVSAVVIIAAVFGFGFRISSVNGSSMEPTLQNRDKLLVSPVIGDCRYKDIVIVAEPNILNEVVVKRVIATEGQWIDVRYDEGLVYVGDTADSMKPLDEPYTASLTDEENPEDRHIYPVQVPDGKVFVMGDNRNDSTDSRSYRVDFVDEDYILGKVIVRLAPYGDFNIYD